jgi:hypothetical protein
MKSFIRGWNNARKSETEHEELLDALVKFIEVLLGRSLTKTEETFIRFGIALFIAIFQGIWDEPSPAWA